MANAGYSSLSVATCSSGLGPSRMVEEVHQSGNGPHNSRIAHCHGQRGTEYHYFLQAKGFPAGRKYIGAMRDLMSPERLMGTGIRAVDDQGKLISGDGTEFELVIKISCRAKRFNSPFWKRTRGSPTSCRSPPSLWRAKMVPVISMRFSWIAYLTATNSTPRDSLQGKRFISTATQQAKSGIGRLRQTRMAPGLEWCFRL